MEGFRSQAPPRSAGPVDEVRRPAIQFGSINSGGHHGWLEPRRILRYRGINFTAADEQPCLRLVLMSASGVKRTWAWVHEISAFDPQRISSRRYSSSVRSKREVVGLQCSGTA